MPAFPVIAALALALQLPERDVDPRATVRSAVSAVEGDSVDAMRAQWEARVRRDPGDRDARLGLATLLRLASQYDDAARAFRALDGSAPAVPDAVTAYARAGLGSISQARGDHRAAARQYARAAQAARAAGEVPAEVQALLGVARARSRLQGPAAALALVDSIGPLVPAADLRLRATYEAGRAAILAQLGRPEARTVALECVELARRAAAPRVEAACYQPIAMDAERRGDTKPAIDLLERVATLNRQARDRWALANTLQWRGYLLSTRGEYGVARATLREAAAHAAAAGNGAALAWASLRLARISRFLQDRAAAIDQVERSVATFREQGDMAGVMEARELEVMLAADAGDYGRARALAAEQLEWARQAARPRLEFTALVAQAALAERERRWGEALARLDSADAVMMRHGMEGWADVLWYHQGLIALRRGDLATAERALDRTLEVLDPMQHVYRYRTRARLADVYARRGDLARAERELETAGVELDAWRATLTDDEVRIAAFQTGEEEDLDLGVPRVVAALAAGGRVESAFAIAERRRARALADQLAQGAALRASRDSAREAAARHPSLGVTTTAAEAAAALPDESTALLEYVTGEHGAPTTLFVVRRVGGRPALRAVVLAPTDSLASGVARLVAMLEAGGDPRALARTLATALLDPALAALPAGISRLVVVPDGPLHRVPFDALRLADGRFTVERYAVTNAPSAAVAAALWRRPRPDERTAGPVRLLALGDPSFADESHPGGTPADDASRSAARPRGDGPRSVSFAAISLPRLRASGAEVRAVARYAPGAVVRVRSWATESFLKREALAPYRVLHLATHALVDERSLARTAIALAPGGGEDGFLTPGELAALDLRADLVVLSACRTAGGVVITGEGVEGLTSPLLQAGARSIVATGWRIDDRRTVALVADLYAALARGEPVAEALRAAKLAALGRGAPAGEWAAFTVVGDGLVTIPLTEPPPRSPWSMAAGLLGAMGAGGGVVAARRRRARAAR